MDSFIKKHQNLQPIPRDHIVNKLKQQHSSVKNAVLTIIAFQNMIFSDFKKIEHYA